MITLFVQAYTLPLTDGINCEHGGVRGYHRVNDRKSSAPHRRNARMLIHPPVLYRLCGVVRRTRLKALLA